ncbi:MAG: hypothetical protein ACOY3E_10725 [Pseudomonadota bacterium]
MSVVILICLVGSFAVHLTVKRKLVAHLLSVMIGVLSSWLLLSSHFGFFDRFFFTNLAWVSAVAIGSTIFTGFCLSLIKRKDDKDVGSE